MTKTKTLGLLLIGASVALASGCGSSASSPTTPSQADVESIAAHVESIAAQHSKTPSAPSADVSHTKAPHAEGSNAAGTDTSHPEGYSPEKLADEANKERSGKAAQEAKENEAEQQNGWEWSQIKSLQSIIEREHLRTKTRGTGAEDYCVALYVADHFTLKQYEAANESQVEEAETAARPTCVGAQTYSNPDNVEIG